MDNCACGRRPGQAPHFLQVLAPEFQVAATCCPILFTKDPETGGFYAGAMFGFQAR
jgi:hypothetical protein